MDGRGGYSPFVYNGFLFPPQTQQQNHMQYFQGSFQDNFQGNVSNPTPSSSRSSPSSTESTPSASSIEENQLRKEKKKYETWTQDEQRLLVQLWAQRANRLESKDARKVWTEISDELKKNFNTKRDGDKCKAKVKYLIEKYKNAKDWNVKQTGGHRRESPFYKEIDEVLGCRDVLTLSYVAEVLPKPKTNESNNGDEAESPESRKDRKKSSKRKREEDEDEDERDKLMSSIEEQNKDMKKFMESFTKMQEQQANTMNTLAGALTAFLQNPAK